MTWVFQSDDRQDEAADAAPNQGSETSQGPYIPTIDPHEHAAVHPNAWPIPPQAAVMRDRRIVEETAATRSTNARGGESQLTKMLKPNVAKDEVSGIPKPPAEPRQTESPPELETKGLVNHLEAQNTELLSQLARNAGIEILEDPDAVYAELMAREKAEQATLEELSGQKARVPNVHNTSMGGPSKRPARRPRSPESERRTGRIKRHKKSSAERATENEVAAERARRAGEVMAAEAAHNDVVATEPIHRREEAKNQDCLRW